MKYRKLPIVIDAMQYEGDAQNGCEIIEWASKLGGAGPLLFLGTDSIEISTLENRPGEAMISSVGDWIIRGVKGEFYPCKPDIFAATYELVEEEVPA